MEDQDRDSQSIEPVEINEIDELRAEAFKKNEMSIQEFLDSLPVYPCSSEECGDSKQMKQYIDYISA